MQHGGRMNLAARRECAAIPGPVWPDVNEMNVGRVCLWRACAGVFVAALVSVMVTIPATAQQTIVIGDDKPSASDGGPESPDTAGVVINNDVLDSLGSPGVAAPALPPSYAAPAQVGVGQVPGSPGAPGTAYRLPGSGQLVISRPSTLLFPPPTFPSSLLTVPAPAGRTARGTAAPDSGKAQSRLLVPKPAEPAAPQVTRPEPAPAVATAVPREPVTQEPAASAEIPPMAEPVAEPTLPPVAPVAPTAEPIAPAEPPAVAVLPPEPAPVAEPPEAPALTDDLLPAPPPAEPAPKSEPAATIEPKPQPEPEPPQSAALPSAASSVDEMRLLFNDGSAELTATAAGQLDGLAGKLLANTEARLQLLAYAKASSDGTSRARRLSLSRALAVRAYLIEKGIRSTRMDVRALGSGFEDGPPDRVDVLPQESTQ